MNKKSDAGLSREGVDPSGMNRYGDTVSEGKDSDDEKIGEGEEDWSSYSSAEFGSTDYNLWEDVTPLEGQEDDSIDDFEGIPIEQLDTHLQEIPAAPSPEGLKHLVRLGTCDYCLGRVGGKKSFGQSLLEAGKDSRKIVIERDPNMSDSRDPETVCPFCEELFEEIDLLSDLIASELENYECSRLQIGAQFPKDQAEVEDDLRKRFGAAGSLPLKSSLTDEIARTLSARLSECKLVNEKPQILALIDMLTLRVQMDVRSHYIYGRYRKLKRGIPQTRWPCRSCKGRGCERCDNTGKQYEDSVQDLIGEPILPIFAGEDHSFHGMGREDIDVRCLGRGRPFVLEIKVPQKRSMDYSNIEKIINDTAQGVLEVDSLRDSSRSEVVRVKDTPAEKSYRTRFMIVPQGTLPVPKPRHRGRNSGKRKRGGAEEPSVDSEKPDAVIAYDHNSLSSLKKDELVALCVEFKLPKTGTKPILIDRLLENQKLSPENSAPPLPDLDTVTEILTGLAGTVLEQRTPTRVAHRRADKVRKRSVIEASDAFAEIIDGELFAEVTLRCESGTYVKETIHGDGGRTIPSVASLLSVDCDVKWLDVADIHAD